MRSDRQGAGHRLRASGSETETGMGAVAGKVQAGGGRVAAYSRDTGGDEVAAGSMWAGNGSRCQ